MHFNYIINTIFKENGFSNVDENKSLYRFNKNVKRTPKTLKIGLTIEKVNKYKIETIYSNSLIIKLFFFWKTICSKSWKKNTKSFTILVVINFPLTQYVVIVIFCKWFFSPQKTFDWTLTRCYIIIRWFTCVFFLQIHRGFFFFVFLIDYLSAAVLSGTRNCWLRVLMMNNIANRWKKILNSKRTGS